MFMILFKKQNCLFCYLYYIHLFLFYLDAAIIILRMRRGPKIFQRYMLNYLKKRCAWQREGERTIRGSHPLSVVPINPPRCSSSLCLADISRFPSPRRPVLGRDRRRSFLLVSPRIADFRVSRDFVDAIQRRMSAPINREISLSNVDCFCLKKMMQLIIEMIKYYKK